MARRSIRPSRVRRPTNRSQLPTEPGAYYWSEWKATVDVTKRGKYLYVTPPGGVEVRITPYIAGTFKPQQEPLPL